MYLGNNRIRAMDEELGQQYLSSDLWEPVLDPKEYSDDYDEVTPDELQRYKEVSLLHDFNLVYPIAQFSSFSWIEFSVLLYF